MAIVVGVLTGLGAVGFRWLITTFTWLFTGYDDYSSAGRVPSLHFPSLGIWFLLLTPVVAGAVYGPIVHKFAPEARGHGVPEVMYAVGYRGGRIASRVTFVKALASALCMGGGGSVGREGPIVQIGSAAGSTIAQLLHLDARRVRLLGPAGGGGISATFNAPLAGPFFAMELILRNFAAESFGAVVLSSVAAAVVGRALLGDHPFLSLPLFSVHDPAEYLLYIVLGVAVGVIGVAFSKVLYLVEDACDWLWRGPEWARPAVGGIALGALLIALPQMYGVGYPALQNAVEGRYVIGDAAAADGRQDVRDELDHRHRRFRRRLRADPVHRRNGRVGIRAYRPRLVPIRCRGRGRVRADRHGRRVGRRRGRRSPR